MGTWAFIIVALFLQEPTTTDAAIFQVRELGLNIWLIHALWIFATTFDMWIGYFGGKLIQKKFKDSRFEAYSRQWALRVESFIGRRGEKFVLILLGIINFPWLNAFIASWLSLPFKTLLILIGTGNAVYWGIAWGINIGVRDTIADPYLALYIVVGIGLLFSITSKTILDRVLKTSSS